MELRRPPTEFLTRVSPSPPNLYFHFHSDRYGWMVKFFRTLVCLMLALHPVIAADRGLEGLVLCGYQGWFRAPGDGSGCNWRHYEVGGKFEPGHSHIEMWPDMDGFGENERFTTAFRHADGREAQVFSSVVPATTQRHFEWMREHGIDGVFLQRFLSDAGDSRVRASLDQVLENCRKSAAATERKWALMYDLSGLRKGESKRLLDDWKRLLESGRLDPMSDPGYLHVNGKPLIALWGMGFTDRETTLDEWRQLLEFFRTDAIPGGCSVMLGVPTYWRTLDRDCMPDKQVHEILRLADVISPWTVGRFATPEDAHARVESLIKPDLAWCAEAGVGYLPVIFPGFSWQNLQKSRGVHAEFDMIPRRGGRFLWSQALAVKQAGLDSAYVAMFDELDEGTAIFKTSQDPPVGKSRFLAEPELPSDHYLWLSGRIGQMLRGEIPATDALPERK